MANQTKQYPKDGLVIISMLKDLGIVNYEPRVINQLLEFATRYVTCVLDDAKAFANHSKKKTIDLDDVKLAIGMQTEKVFTTPPPRDLLLEVARSKNSIPLPSVKPHCGIRLPPDRYCFSACNFRLKSASKKMSDKIKYSISNSGGVNQLSSNLNNGPPLKMAKTSGNVTSSGNTGGVPVVKRPTSNNVARSQAITAVAKPLIKLTTNSSMSASQQQVQAKARIQVTPGGNGTEISTSSGTIQQQTQSQQIQQQLQSQQTAHHVEIKVEPSDSNSSTTVLSANDQLAGIKRKREEEFGGLENHWRRLVIAVPQSSSDTYKVNRGKSVPWNRSYHNINPQ
ncbi:hypothetical protein O3M35_010736 [Rhynocoris fuscipes]|uniref:Transcription initiation factor TFIID subunit 9 n=1 Tax=Rhynocoris fuscipes TaxID=488301 RepID=A0AAW1D058_9HEMI